MKSGRKLSVKFIENRKQLWKKVKKENNVRGVIVRLKREDGTLVSSKEEVKIVWKIYIECLMNDKSVEKAVAATRGMGAGVTREQTNGKQYPKISVVKLRV